MSPLAGRTALVTGSSRGIGRATAIALARAGARVVLAARGAADLERAARAVAEAGPAPRVERCDFGRAAEVEALFDRLEGDGVEIDVLVNNVGVARPAAFAEVGDEEWQRHWEVNVMSAVRASRRVLPGMAARGFGRIVNVSSSAAKRPSARWPAYAPTKAALQALAVVLADAYGARGITANSVCPGPVRSPLWTAPGGLADELAAAGDDEPEAVLARLADGVPVGRMGTPEEIAAAIAFLATPAAGYVNGAALSVDGGNVRTIV